MGNGRHDIPAFAFKKYNNVPIVPLTSFNPETKITRKQSIEGTYNIAHFSLQRIKNPTSSIAALGDAMVRH
jgi:hypothetical protein